MVAQFLTSRQAVTSIQDGHTVALSGFGLAGQPMHLLEALGKMGLKDLTIIANNAGNGENGLAKLLASGSVKKIICSFPRQADSYIFDELYRSGKILLELVPQGTLAEQIRCQGAGIGGFYTPSGVGTDLAKGKEVRTLNGKDFVFEYPTNIDVALVHAQFADQQGNIVYRKTARNFGPIMAAAAHHTIVEVQKVLPVGSLDPENIVTPSIYVDAVVELAQENV